MSVNSDVCLRGIRCWDIFFKDRPGNLSQPKPPRLGNNGESNPVTSGRQRNTVAALLAKVLTCSSFLDPCNLGANRASSSGTRGDSLQKCRIDRSPCWLRVKPPPWQLCYNTLPTLFAPMFLLFPPGTSSLPHRQLPLKSASSRRIR